MLATERLNICKYTTQMAGALSRLSRDPANRTYLPDEVFETEADAERAIELFLDEYEGSRGPFVYAVTLKDGTYIGHVEAALTGQGDWEVGFHIAEACGGHGYGAEALGAFLPFICEKLGLEELLGICLEENIASWKTLEKCGFRLEYEGQGRYQGFVQKIRRYVWSPAAPPDIDDFWRGFVGSQGLHPRTEYREALCLDDNDVGQPKLRSVLEGKKTAACSSAAYWEWLEEELPQPGDFSIITDREGDPCCVIETMEVHRMPLRDVPWPLARLEDEGADLEEWRQKQTARFEAEAQKLRYDFSDGMEVLLEEFEVIWQR